PVDAGDEVSSLAISINDTLAALQRSQQERHLQEAFLEQLFESAPEAIAILDKDNRVARVNQEFSRMFGYSPQEGVERNIADLIVPLEGRQEALRLTSEVDQGKSISTEAVRRRKDGTPVEVSILGTPVHVSGGQVAIYAIYRDISERQRRDEALRVSEE